MAEVRLFAPSDHESLLELMAEASSGVDPEQNGSTLIPDGVQVWLACPSNQDRPNGFCRLVPDRETRARGRSCLDMLFIRKTAQQPELARLLMAECLAGARAKGMDGIWGYLSEPLTPDTLKATQGKKLREIRLLRHSRLAQFSSLHPPDGFRLRTFSLPSDLELAAQIYNETFSEMWNFRPHSPKDIAEWFDGSDTSPEDCFILEHVSKDLGSAKGAGMVVTCIDQERASQPNLSAYIPDIGITPAYRRQGLGHVLLAAAVGRAKTKGVSTIELVVDEQDEGAKSFYRKLEFEEMGKIYVYEWV